MSDFMDEDEEYDFQYEDQDEEEADVGIENQYYNSKAFIESEPKEALQGFEEVVKMEGKDKGEWGFKALKKIVKLHFRLGNYDKMLERYKEMLTYIKSAVTRNKSEKTINSILEFMSSSQQWDLLQEFYRLTLRALQEAKNDRLWFKTNLKFGQLWFEQGEYGKMQKILKDLHKACQNEDGTEDTKLGTQLLEVYALEIQMFTEQKNNKKLKQLYTKALQVKSAIPHPRVMAVIRECGGKMHMSDKEWEKAYLDFFEAFKFNDECGAPRRIQCLKYLLLANMLMVSNINPFDAVETKPFKNDPEVQAMTNLIGAYQRRDITAFEKILHDNKQSIMGDMFIRNHIEELIKNIRTQVLLRVVKPYTRLRIPFLSAELNVSNEEVEALLVSLILDGQVTGHIDQVNQLLVLEESVAVSQKKYDAIQKWTQQISNVSQGIATRVVHR